MITASSGLFFRRPLSLRFALAAFAIAHSSFAQTNGAPATSLEYLSKSPISRTYAATERNNLSAPNWNAAASSPGGSIARYAFAQNGQSLYVISGFYLARPINSVRRYDATTNTWTSLADIPIATEAPVAVFWKNKIYVADGYGPLSQNRLRIYDVANDSWSAASIRPGVADSYGSAIAAFDDKIYLIGGGSSDGTNSIVSVYDTISGTWSSAPAPLAPVLFGGYAQLGQYLYVVGGFSSIPVANSTTSMRFDLQNQTWSIGPAFTPQRGDFALVAAGTKLYAIGGDENGGSYFNPSAEVDELDTAQWPLGAWTASPDNLPTPRQANSGAFFTTAISGGEIWSTGGFGGGLLYLDEHLFRSFPPGSAPPGNNLLSAASRMTHGNAGVYDLPLPLTGVPPVEPRSGGATGDYQIVLNFAAPVSVTGSPHARITGGTGLVGTGGTSNGGAVTLTGSSVIVPLTNVANAQTLTVAVAGLTNGAPATEITVSMRVLIGDSSDDAAVNSADVSQVRSNSGKAAGATTFRTDLNADGIVNSADVSIARAASGTNVRPAAPVSVVSRKAHGSAGTFDIALPLAGTTGVECRSSGLTSDYQLVIDFPTRITINGSPKALITSGVGMVGTGGTENAGAVSVDGSRVIVPLTNVANAQALTVALNNVTDGNGIGSIAVPFRILVGDANGDGFVNAADAAQTRANAGQLVTATTFRSDLNADGGINSADTSIARANSGSSVPPPTPLSAVSRKRHGSAGIMDLALPLTGSSGIECRAGGLTSDYELVINFSSTVKVTGVPQATIASGAAVIGVGGAENGGTVTVNGSSVTVPLTTVLDGQALLVTLHGVSDENTSGDVTIPFGLLIGDTNGDGLVNAADVLQTSSRSGQAASAATFRSDVNADGAVNSADSALIRGRSGNSLP
ncbi:MAG: dockerin type I domain-containing protein [Verrucomicrobiota bacterium]|nr:dockerin type I domain-containing protein [Verrucomicrobiota bacterium]